MSLAFLVFDIGLILKWMTRCEGISFLLNIKKSGSQVPKMNGAGLTKQNKGCGHVFLLREKKTKQNSGASFSSREGGEREMWLQNSSIKA